MSKILPEDKPLTELSSVNGNTPLSVIVENSVNVTKDENFVNDVQDSTHEVDYLTISGFESSSLSSASLSANLLVDEFNVEDKLNKTFIGKQLLSIPFNCRVVAKNTYNRLLKLPVKGAFQANTYLRELCDFCKSMPVDVTWSDSQIELVGKTQASQCLQIVTNMHNLGDSKKAMVFALEAVLVGFSIKARKGKYIDGDIARYACDKWWRKKLSKLHSVSVERVSQYVHLVSKKSQIYVTDANFRKGRENKRRNQLFMAELELVNERGDVVDLTEMANSTNANPVNRRNELMARLHGFEVYADKHGYVADFLTITCPSRMHPVHSSGRPNEKFDSTSPKQANQYLGSQFAKCRAHLARLNVDYFGFRVAEPHHDATPHWHILVFVKPEQRHILRDTFSFYALQVDGDEAGAQKYRFTVEPILKSKGSAVGYIAKYISKNIDGFGVDKDNYGNPADIAALRVSEWSSLWGIRQFQQFGGPPVSLWREARRLALKEEVNISSVWVAADSGNWCEFIEALGGVNVKRKDLPVQLVKEFIETEGEYLEPIGYVIKGLSCGGEVYVSREHTWTKRRKENESSLGLGENEV
jgi:hypothetical protein